jgi:hypothetical protein
MKLLLWLFFRGRRCPWGCGDWVSDDCLVGHYLVEHGGD